MPSKMHPSDWDNLFAPNAPRRGGPLRALTNTLIALAIVVVLSAGAIYAVRYRNKQVAAQLALVPTMQAQATQMAATSAAATATRVAQRTATAVARQPTAAPAIGVGAVASGGNLRSEPRVAADTVVGLIWPGDQITFLEQRPVGGQTWYRIRVTQVAPNRGGAGVEAGTEGWASSTLLSPPAPVPAP